MDDKFYYNNICKISKHANKLHSYLHVLKCYAENEYVDDNAVPNMLDILEISVDEINAILKYI